MDLVLRDLLDELTQQQHKKTIRSRIINEAYEQTLRKPGESVILRQSMAKSSFEYNKQMCVASLTNRKATSLSQLHLMDSQPPSSKGIFHRTNPAKSAKGPDLRNR